MLKSPVPICAILSIIQVLALFPLEGRKKLQCCRFFVCLFSAEKVMVKTERIFGLYLRCLSNNQLRH